MIISEEDMIFARTRAELQETIDRLTFVMTSYDEFKAYLNKWQDIEDSKDETSALNIERKKMTYLLAYYMPMLKNPSNTLVKDNVTQRYDELVRAIKDAVNNFNDNVDYEYKSIITQISKELYGSNEEI